MFTCCIMLVYFLILFQLILVHTARYQKPVAEKIWDVRCNINDHVLNDCNWCSCGLNHRFQCKARVCEEVDVFGHFKDTIQELDVGMEGHGSWRSRPTSCSPGVHYTRGAVVCICDADGNWPNPVCRDLFRVLYSVEVTEKVEEFTTQSCLPTKLYLVGCNACFCPETGKLDPNLCTNRTCVNGDPVLEHKDDLKPKKVKTKASVTTIKYDNAKPSVSHIETKDNDAENTDSNEDEESSDSAIVIGKVNKALEIYGPCSTEKTYRVGQTSCECLANNRLVCEDYDQKIARAKKHDQVQTIPLINDFCKEKIGKTFKEKCNMCVCTVDGLLHCSIKKCLPRTMALSLDVKKEKFKKRVAPPWHDLDCVPGTTFKRGCRTCSCHFIKHKKTVTCSVDSCHKKVEDIINDCVPGTTYEKDCLTCTCDEIDGHKHEACKPSPKCDSSVKSLVNYPSVDLLDGNCEPMKFYKKDCNKCTCLKNGKEVLCTTKLCRKRPVLRSNDEVEVDIVPFHQAESEVCPEGHSYKIECNICVCLPNGNAICTTSDCSKGIVNTKF